MDNQLQAINNDISQQERKLAKANKRFKTTNIIYTLAILTATVASIAFPPTGIAILITHGILCAAGLVYTSSSLAFKSWRRKKVESLGRTIERGYSHALTSRNKSSKDFKQHFKHLEQARERKNTREKATSTLSAIGTIGLVTRPVISMTPGIGTVANLVLDAVGWAATAIKAAASLISTKFSFENIKDKRKVIAVKYVLDKSTGNKEASRLRQSRLSNLQSEKEAAIIGGALGLTASTISAIETASEIKEGLSATPEDAAVESKPEFDKITESDTAHNIDASLDKAEPIADEAIDKTVKAKQKKQKARKDLEELKNKLNPEQLQEAVKDIQPLAHDLTKSTNSSQESRKSKKRKRDNEIKK